MLYIQRLRDLRTDRNLTQEDVAKILHTSQGYYSKYELGIREIPLHHILTLCTYYDVSADYLLGFTDIYKCLPKK